MPNRKIITVTLRADGKDPRARLRFRRIHGALISGLGQGSDLFRIRIIEKKKVVLLAWPDDPIGLDDQDMEKLEDLVGIDNIEIQETP